MDLRENVQRCAILYYIYIYIYTWVTDIIQTGNPIRSLKISYVHFILTEELALLSFLLFLFFCDVNVDFETIVLPMFYYVIHAFSHLLMPEGLDSSWPFIEIRFQKSKEQLLNGKKKIEGGADKWCM